MRYPKLSLVLVAIFGPLIFSSPGAAGDTITIGLTATVNVPTIAARADWTVSDIKQIEVAIAERIADHGRANFDYWNFSVSPTDSEFRMMLKVSQSRSNEVRLTLLGYYPEKEPILTRPVPILTASQVESMHPFAQEGFIDIVSQTFVEEILDVRPTFLRVRNYVYSIPIGLRSAWKHNTDALNMKLVVDLPSDKMDLLRKRKFFVLCSLPSGDNVLTPGHRLDARGSDSIIEHAFDESPDVVEALLVHVTGHTDDGGERKRITIDNFGLVGDLQPGRVLLNSTSEPSSISAVISDLDQ